MNTRNTAARDYLLGQMNSVEERLLSLKQETDSEETLLEILSPLEIEAHYTAGGELAGARILFTFGGPLIWLDWRAGQDSALLFGKYSEGLEVKELYLVDLAEELYYSYSLHISTPRKY
jgi:hypothetical protein